MTTRTLLAAACVALAATTAVHAADKPLIPEPMRGTWCVTWIKDKYAPQIFSVYVRPNGPCPYARLDVTGNRIVETPTGTAGEFDTGAEVRDPLNLLSGTCAITKIKPSRSSPAYAVDYDVWSKCDDGSGRIWAKRENMFLLPEGDLRINAQWIKLLQSVE